MKSILSFLTAAAFLVATASAANQCPKGKGPDANGVCQYCSPGYYNDQDAGVCQPAQAGWYACGSQPMCFGATQQTQCGAGNYSGTGSSQCTTCPAGNICPSNTQTQPQQCVPGRYMDTTGSGATECKSCPVGTYNNEYGAVACCNCCAGTYNDQVSQTHCFYCGEHTNPQVFYSPVGATSVSQCQANPIAGTTNAPKGTCDVTPPLGTKAPGNCPAEQGTPLPTSGVQPKKRHLQCKKGFKKCPLYTGIGGFDCVDVRNDPEQCGGCVAVDGVTSASKGNEGTDCTAIPNVSIVGCVKGKCVVETCRKGFTKSEDGSACESAALKVQRHQQHSDSSKRNARRWHVSHSEN